MFLKYQSNTDIFFLILLLLPNKLSIDHRTNSVFEDDGLVDGIFSCRIELLHLLLDVTSDCVVAFDLAAKTFKIGCDACSSGRSAGTSVLLLFESNTNLFDP